MRHFWPPFHQWLDELPDTRFQPFVVYHRRFLAWYGLGLFVFKLGSRRQVDYDLRDLETHLLANLNRLAGTHQETLPVHKTLDHFLGHLGAAPLASLRNRMIRRLIRMKALDACRLEGCFVIALDGTGHLCFHRRHCAQCLVQTHENTTLYLHNVLEAKLVSPSGLALSMATEFIENPPPKAEPQQTDPQGFKQDCELKAFSRLARGLKQAFPQTRFCITGDALYACGRAIQIATDNGWSYFFTFKPTDLPAVWADFQGLLPLCPENTLRVRLPNGPQQVYRWVNGMSYEDHENRPHHPPAIGEW